jgi:hypothetical protein
MVVGYFRGFGVDEERAAVVAAEIEGDGTGAAWGAGRERILIVAGDAVVEGSGGALGGGGLEISEFVAERGGGWVLVVVEPAVLDDDPVAEIGGADGDGLRAAPLNETLARSSPSGVQWTPVCSQTS